jgi:hypothetical protein
MNPTISDVSNIVSDITTSSAEISMKTKLNKAGDKVLVLLELPQAQTVGFHLYDRQQNLIFKWNDQVLTEGRNELVLPIPSIAPAVYTISMESDKQSLQHLLILRK